MERIINGCGTAQSLLPGVIPLVQYNPQRRGPSSSDVIAAEVRSDTALPPHLILGDLRPDGITFSEKGWKARWQGFEKDTWFECSWEKAKGVFELRQFWCGADGGWARMPAKLGLPRAISQGAYFNFPETFDEQAKKLLESKYQLEWLTLPNGMPSICFVPDGAFRTIAVPIHVSQLQYTAEFFHNLDEKIEMKFPFGARAVRLVQAINHVEGRSVKPIPSPGELSTSSIQETGFFPYEFPVREVANDGSAAWTVRRFVYVVFVEVPFAGITQMLAGLQSGGIVRSMKDQDIDIALRPFCFPLGLDGLTAQISIWDKSRAKRVTWVMPEKVGVLKRIDGAADEDTNSRTESLIVDAGIFSSLLNKQLKGAFNEHNYQ